MSKFALERKNYNSYIEIDSARPASQPSAGWLEDAAMPSESTNYLDDLD